MGWKYAIAAALFIGLCVIAASLTMGYALIPIMSLARVAALFMIGVAVFRISISTAAPLWTVVLIGVSMATYVIVNYSHFLGFRVAGTWLIEPVLLLAGAAGLLAMSAHIQRVFGR